MREMIGIIGQGFVGTAVREGMRHAFDILAYDKKHEDVLITWKSSNEVFSLNQSDDVFRDIVQAVDVIFVCVPTPMKLDGSCDTSIVEDVVARLAAGLGAGGWTPRVVVIKSTIPPGTVDRLNEQYAESDIVICFNPEFLTERSPNEDFKNQDRIILGGPREATNRLKAVYERAYPQVPTIKTSSTIAETVKYMTNCFLATKVAFANEMYQICDKLNIDYDKVVEYATRDKRLGTSHWAVPGPMPADDGSGRYMKGFGGSCFCKDINALMSLARDLGVDPKVMSGVWEKNLEVRPERDWEQLKGRAVVDQD